MNVTIFLIIRLLGIIKLRNTMKKILISLLLTLFISNVSAKSFVDEVTDIIGNSPEVNINLGTNILKTILSFSGDEDAKQVRKALTGLNKIRVSVFEFKELKNKDKLQKTIAKKVKKLSSQGYEQIVTVKDDDETVHIMAKVKGQFLHDAMVVVLEQDEMVIITLGGSVDLQQLAQISDHFDVDLNGVL